MNRVAIPLNPEKGQACQGARRRGRSTGRLSTINPDAAGVDVGSTFHVVAVPADRDDRPVRTSEASALIFTSWLSLAPGNKISGGGLLGSKTRRFSNRAAALLRIAAVNVRVLRTKGASSSFFRRSNGRVYAQQSSPEMSPPAPSF
jgi:hypothetical protein